MVGRSQEHGNQYRADADCHAILQEHLPQRLGIQFVYLGCLPRVHLLSLDQRTGPQKLAGVLVPLDPKGERQVLRAHDVSETSKL